MAVALSIFGVAFAALCVWLTVRLVNRQFKSRPIGFLLELVGLLAFVPCLLSSVMVITDRVMGYGAFIPDDEGMAGLIAVTFVGGALSQFGVWLRRP
jgi:hypothetical protein